MSNINIAYANSTAITITLTGLTTVSARESAAIDNTTNKYLDAMVSLKLFTRGPLAGDKTCYIYFYGSEDGTNYSDNATGNDTSLTMKSPTNLKGPFPISVHSTGVTIRGMIGSVASFFGGILPQKWGIVVSYQGSSSLSATAADLGASYTGVYETVA